MVEKPVLNNKGRVTGQREIRLVWNNTQRVNHQNKLTHPRPKRNFVPTSVTTMSADRPVNTAAPKPKVNDTLPTTQDKYVADILKKFDFSLVKTTSTPLETNKALIKDEEAEDVDVHLYRSMIGSLMYLTASRPDIMFAVCACARFQVTLKTSHLHAVKRIFRYLKGQPKLGLWYPRDSPFDLEAF
ncbi:hypothetical protein Tco_1386548 [Tanacetum coccineum]